MEISIIADNREKSSGIPDILIGEGVELKFLQLSAGDYIINENIIIERKTNTDFIQSVISGRLFNQCSGLRKSTMRPLIIVEGNPFKTDSKISSESIKGALLSVTLSWQIPVIRSSGKEDTAGLMIMAAQQQTAPTHFIKNTGIKPKALQSKRHFFVRNMPGIGPQIAINLLSRFKTIENIILAGEEELMEIEGIGRKKAEALERFFREEY